MFKGYTYTSLNVTLRKKLLSELNFLKEKPLHGLLIREI